MVTSFNANFRSHHDKDVLKNRYKHLRRQYNEVKILLDQVGFSWDEKREMVQLKIISGMFISRHILMLDHTELKQCHHHKLCVIYGQDNSDGRYSRLARNVDPDSVY
ncbi:unnamed protein product [Ilex paraguariensis]|uniref:Myb/SANT-like domain-containing protein n=1 Tax=Ilex paraguariensis TaxID=185542 RepID=A0ABC8T9T7_9AQUA